MATLFDISATLATSTTRPATIRIASDVLGSSAADRLAVSIAAMGLCVLVVWIFRRLIHPRKLLLRDAPGRPNNLGWLHILIILAWTFGNTLLALFADPPEAEPVGTVDAMVKTYVVMLVVLAVALAAAHVGFRHGIVRGLGLTARRWFTDASRGIFGIVAVYPICAGLFVLSDSVVPERFKATHELLDLLGGEVTAAQTLLAVGLAFVVAPVVEEVLYRGLLQTALRRILGGPWRAILVSSILFAAMHLTIEYEPLRVVGCQTVLPLFALAIVMGYSYERTGRLGPSILIHMLFNGINLTCALLNAGEGNSP